MIKTANIVQEWIDEGIQQGIKEGMQQGVRQATQQDILEIIEDRFNLVPDEIVKSVKQIDEVAVLHMVLRKAAKVTSLDEFREILRALTSCDVLRLIL
ncbi:MAG: hypothetical protein AB1847_09265 [bacterium]